MFSSQFHRICPALHLSDIPETHVIFRTVIQSSILKTEALSDWRLLRHELKAFRNFHAAWSHHNQNDHIKTYSYLNLYQPAGTRFWDKPLKQCQRISLRILIVISSILYFWNWHHNICPEVCCRLFLQKWTAIRHYWLSDEYRINNKMILDGSELSILLLHDGYSIAMPRYKWTSLCFATPYHRFARLHSADNWCNPIRLQFCCKVLERVWKIKQDVPSGQI